MSEQTIPYKIYLQESELPTAWYNMRADMKTDRKSVGRERVC